MAPDQTIQLVSDSLISTIRLWILLTRILTKLQILLESQFVRGGARPQRVDGERGKSGLILTERIRERMTGTALRDGRSTNWSDIEEHILTTELE